MNHLPSFSETPHIDCHIHMILDGVFWRDAIDRHRASVCEAQIRATLDAYRQRGITYLRDGGDRWGVCTRASQIAPEYGICYSAPAFPIYKVGHYGSFIGRGFSTMKEYRQLVLQAKHEGASFIKIMVSGLMDFEHLGVLTDEPLCREEISEMISIAHGEGFAVMAHANGDAPVSAAIAAGVDSIEHGAYLHDETLHQLSQSHTVWVPTLVTIGNLIGDGRFPDAVLVPLLEGAMENVSAAASLGAKIALGSDAGAYRVPHAQATQDEYQLLTQALGQNAHCILQRGADAIQSRFSKTNPPAP